jgi:DNA gyrase subunit A
MFITRKGVVNRQSVAEIRTIGRATQGVRLVNLDEGDEVMDVARVIMEDDENGDGMLEIDGDLPVGPGGDASVDADSGEVAGRGEDVEDIEDIEDAEDAEDGEGTDEEPEA